MASAPATRSVIKVTCGRREIWSCKGSTSKRAAGGSDQYLSRLVRRATFLLLACESPAHMASPISLRSGGASGAAGAQARESDHSVSWDSARASALTIQRRESRRTAAGRCCACCQPRLLGDAAATNRSPAVVMRRLFSQSRYRGKGYTIAGQNAPLSAIVWPEWAMPTALYRYFIVIIAAWQMFTCSIAIDAHSSIQAALMLKTNRIAVDEPLMAHYEQTSIDLS